MNLIRDRWMFVPVLFLGATVTSAVLTVKFAVAGRPLGVEPDYYEKGRDHESVRRQAAMNDRLGWIVAPTIEAGRDGLPRLAIAVTDKRGIRIPADEASVEAIPIRNADLRTEVRLEPVDEGRFAADIPLRISGQWEFRLTVRRGEEIYTDRFRRSLGFATAGGAS